MKKSIAAATIAGSMLVGGGIGIAVFGPHLATAQTPSTTNPPATSGQSGTFRSNEDATHEAGESAQREADENAGRAFRHDRNGSFTPNEDATHEAGESAQREADEDARRSGAGQTPSTQTQSGNAI